MTRMEPPLIPLSDDALVQASESAAAATADSSGPPPSSAAPGTSEPPQQPGPAQVEPDAPAEFDPRHRDLFSGLIYLGYLEETVVLWGHTFRLVTPSRMERLQGGALHQPYLGTLSADLAYETVMVAMFLTKVDGHELPQPVLTDPKENAVRDRFEWVAQNLREGVIGRLYEQVLLLDQKVLDVLEAMGKASG